MSTYRDFVKEMMPKMMGHPPKERLKMIGAEWQKKKGSKGGMMSAAGLDEVTRFAGEQSSLDGGRVSAAGLPALEKKKRQKSDSAVVSSKTRSNELRSPAKRAKKAVGGMLEVLKLGLPEGMKDSNKLSGKNANKLEDHIAVAKGKEFAHRIVGNLKHFLDSIGKKK